MCRILEKHRLDLADAYKIFESPTWEFEDERFDYPETRVITIGFLGGLLVAVLACVDSTRFKYHSGDLDAKGDQI